jgi:glycosyltransferase involved in cell wall biosynthesis
MKNALHIAVVSGSLRTGGAERAMIELANGLANEGILTTLVVVNGEGDLSFLIGGNVRFVSLHARRARIGIGAFRKFLLENRPQVIIAAQSHVQLMALLAAKLTRYTGKIILNEHSLFSVNTSSRLVRAGGRILFRYADAVTAVSDAVAEDYKKIFSADERKIFVIPNAVNIESILTMKEEIIQADADDLPIVLAAGRLTKSKNYPLLINAFSLVVKKRPARLIILGEGEQKESLLKLIRQRNISHLVSLPGNVMNPFKYMKQCSVFVLTSVYEGLPTVLIEALACGCNIVTTESGGGAAAVLAEGNLGTITCEDEVLLSEAIISNMGPRTMISQKLQRAKDFSTSNTVKKYLDLIQKLGSE